MKFYFPVFFAGLMLAACEAPEATPALPEQPVAPAGMDALAMPDGTKVYFDPNSLEPGEANGRPAISGEFVEVLETKEGGWAYRRSRIAANCNPDHNQSTIIETIDGDGQPVDDEALVTENRTISEKSAYYRAMTGRLCAAEGAPG